jgi:carboxyvinyl-carboxyphosphonate phosphorylmutase
MRTVQELESAGIAGLTIEDTLLPRPFDDGTTRPTSIDEGVGKMKAAVAARMDPQLIIMARTGAIGMTGLEDTLARIRAYQETGVDAIFLSGVKTRAEVEAIHAAAKLPVVLGTMSPEIDDKAFLAANGIHVALQGHAPSMAAMEATRATLQALRDGVKPKALTGLASDALLKSVSRDGDYRAAIKAFMTK